MWNYFSQSVQQGKQEASGPGTSEPRIKKTRESNQRGMKVIRKVGYLGSRKYRTYSYLEYPEGSQRISDKGTNIFKTTFKECRTTRESEDKEAIV